MHILLCDIRSWKSPLQTKLKFLNEKASFIWALGSAYGGEHKQTRVKENINIVVLIIDVEKIFKRLATK